MREQRVADLDDTAAFDLAWLPAPFVPPAAVRTGLVRIRAALRYGGTALDDDAALALLRETGFADVRTLPSPPGAPALTIGRAA